MTSVRIRKQGKEVLTRGVEVLGLFQRKISVCELGRNNFSKVSICLKISGKA